MTFVWMLRLPSTRRMFSFSATRRRAKARALTDDQARELMLAARDRRRRGGVRARVHDRSGLPAAAAEGAASCSRCRGPWAGFPVLFLAGEHDRHRRPQRNLGFGRAWKCGYPTLDPTVDVIGRVAAAGSGPGGLGRRGRRQRRPGPVGVAAAARVRGDRLRPRFQSRMVPSRWTCSKTPCGPRASRRSTSTTTSPPAYATTGRDLRSSSPKAAPYDGGRFQVAETTAGIARSWPCSPGTSGRSRHRSEPSASSRSDHAPRVPKKRPLSTPRQSGGRLAPIGAGGVSVLLRFRAVPVSDRRRALP